MKLSAKRDFRDIGFLNQKRLIFLEMKGFEKVREWADQLRKEDIEEQQKDTATKAALSELLSRFLELRTLLGKISNLLGKMYISQRFRATHSKFSKSAANVYITLSDLNEELNMKVTPFLLMLEKVIEVRREIFEAWERDTFDMEKNIRKDRFSLFPKDDLSTISRLRATAIEQNSLTQSDIDFLKKEIKGKLVNAKHMLSKNADLWTEARFMRDWEPPKPVDVDKNNLVNVGGKLIPKALHEHQISVLILRKKARTIESTYQAALVALGKFLEILEELLKEETFIARLERFTIKEEDKELHLARLGRLLEERD